MTTREQFLATLGKLLMATRNSQLVWEVTAEEGVYRAAFRRATVEIGRVENDASAQWADATPHSLRARLYNSNNAVVEEVTESFEETNGDEPFRLLRELYELARDSALRPVDLLKSIEDELSHG